MSVLATLSAGRLHVDFIQLADRVQHRLRHDDDGVDWGLDSVEGDSLSEWPCSPPFQELHLHDTPHGRIALLVGKAGKCHWSTSIEIDPAGEHVQFDVACRVTVEPQWLGSSYALISSALQINDAGDYGPWRLIGVADADPVHMERLGDQFTVRPLVMDESPPQTVRWKYRVQRVEA